MKDYINRYVYAVTRRLPQASRDEVEAELHAHIRDMLSENPDDEEIDRMLHELGHPRDIAANYTEKKRYVIAPEFYADYELTLKIGLVGIGVFTLFITALSALLSVDQPSVWAAIGYVFSQIISGTFGAVVYGFAFITIGFWIASSESIRKQIKPWKLKDLMEVPKDYKTTTYKHTHAIIALVFQVIASAVFIVILIYFLNRFGIYRDDALIAPLFGYDLIVPYIPFIIVGQALAIIAQAMLVIQRKFSVPMLIIYTVGSVLSVVLTIIIIQTPGFITDQFINTAAQNAGMVSADLAYGIHVAIIVLTVLMILGTIGDLFSQWRKLYKQKSN